MSGLRFDLYAASVLAPGLASLGDLRAACLSGKPPEVTGPLVLPPSTALPANERRRASQAVRLALACIEQLVPASPFPIESLRSVFATDEGTGETCQQMLEVLAASRQVSPLLFPNSVQNAPSGYFSIAWRNRQASTLASLGHESFASGLLCAVTEAATTDQPVLLVAYDPLMTEPIDEVLRVTEHAATAWILSTGQRNQKVPVLGSFALELEQQGETPPSPLPSWLPPRWAEHSSARALAALGLLEESPGTTCRFTLGGQILSMFRVDGAGA